MLNNFSFFTKAPANHANEEYFGFLIDISLTLSTALLIGLAYKFYQFKQNRYRFHRQQPLNAIPDNQAVNMNPAP